MIEPDLLKLLVCPESHQPVRIADDGVIEVLNQRILAANVTNRGGRRLTTPISSGLIREDGKLLYPIRNNLPIMLIDEAIPIQ